MEEPSPEIVARTTRVGAGPAAAATAALAADVLTTVAQASEDDWPNAHAVARKSGELAHVARRFALSGADALSEARAALAGAIATDDRDLEIARRLDETVAQLSEVVDLAADIATLAAQGVKLAEPNVRVDALGAVILAGAVAEVGVELIGVNLALVADDPRLRAARDRLAEVQALRRDLPDPG